MLSKAFSRKGTSCKVTFRLSGAEVQVGASVLGDFNDWSPGAHPLRRRRDGTYSATVSLPAGRVYRFRYLVDDERWLNDEQADKLVPNRFGSLDSLIEL